MTITGTARSERSFAQVRELFAPIFARIAEGAAQRDRERQLPFEQVRWLKQAGFGALRVPSEHGGFGLSLPELFALLVDLAAADANLPQIFRGHIAFVEDRLHSPDRVSAHRWFARFAAGETVGNAWSENGPAVVGTLGTTLARDGGLWRLDGAKYYTTGSIFADWADVTATREDGVGVTVLVRTDAEGVEIRDDWDGFGQRTTGTGAAIFDAVRVEDEDVTLFEERFSYQTALYQLVLLAVQAGIARAAREEVAGQLRDRSRVFSHGLAPLAKDDGQLQAVVGEVASIAFVAEAAVERVARVLAQAAELEHERGSERQERARAEAEIASAQAQVVLSELVPRAGTLLFNALSASAVSASRDLDRHWRNARTVASHNPVVYKARIVGDWFVNGAHPPYIWHIGQATPGRAGQEPVQRGE